MKARPAPLFFVALAFAAGCGMGMGSAIPSTLFLVLLGGVGVVWLVLISLGKNLQPMGSSRLQTLRVMTWVVFLMVVAVSGGFLGAIRIQLIPWDDLRKLGEAKYDSGTQWRGVIVSQARKRASGSVDFILKVNHWRPLSLHEENEGKKSWQPASGRIFVEIHQKKLA